MSMLQLVTAMGCVIATLFKVRTAANLQANVTTLLNNLSVFVLVLGEQTTRTCHTVLHCIMVSTRYNH